MLQSADYFVLVFGDPNTDGDEVGSGVYEAGPNYPPFTMKPGDLLLLYCTSNYADYPMKVPGIGVAVETGQRKICYRWIALKEPIARQYLLEQFDEEDRAKMTQLGMTSRRAFKITAKSFNASISSQKLG